MDIKEIQNKNIDLIFSKEKLIILEFYTAWCPTCKMVGMVLEEIEETRPDVLILQVNADENKELANLYKVRTAPTLLFIYKGEILEIRNGFIDEGEIEEIISAVNTK